MKFRGIDRQAGALTFRAKPRASLTSVLCDISVGSVPPPAPERLKQCGRIRESAGACRYRGLQDRLIGLFDVQHGEDVDLTDGTLLISDVQCGAGSLLGLQRGPEHADINIQHMKGIGGVLEGGDDRATILGLGLVDARIDGAFLGQQRATVEEGLRHAANQAPKHIALLERSAGLRGYFAPSYRQNEPGRHAHNDYVYLRSGDVQLLFRSTNTEALLRQIRRQ